MTTKLISNLRGALVFSLILINTLFWSVFLFPLAFLKIIIPLTGWRRLIRRAINWVSSNWISVNNFNLALTNPVRWDVEGLEELKMDEWYLVLANHQTWTDILVLQKIFNRRVPFLKFFLKKELIWVPIMGLVWWALEYPFMSRFSAKYLEKHPEMKGKDLETTRKACEKFKTIPVSVMNFVEGTRFTAAKHEAQKSPYRHLLRPKAAGIAYVFSAMDEYLGRILDVTIAYPGGAKTIWDYLCGRVPEIKVRVQSLPIGPELKGDYFGDDKFRGEFQAWLNEFWRKKDEGMEELLNKA
jgi:1-acyl-sn-glycerol-3-phosphate acyltransferase